MIRSSILWGNMEWITTKQILMHSYEKLFPMPCYAKPKMKKRNGDY